MLFNPESPSKPNTEGRKRDKKWKQKVSSAFRSKRRKSQDQKKDETTKQKDLVNGKTKNKLENNKKQIVVNSKPEETFQTHDQFSCLGPSKVMETEILRRISSADDLNQIYRCLFSCKK